MSEPVVASIALDLEDEDAMRLWRTVAAVARQLGDDNRWRLIGGPMVALFALEAEQTARAMTDIVILADARARPSGTPWVTDELGRLGASLSAVDGSRRATRLSLRPRGLLVDVLAQTAYVGARPAPAAFRRSRCPAAPKRSRESKP